MIINEKYLIYFYILSFFLLISLILIYKKSKIIKNIVTFFAIIILIIQTSIVYDTYPLMEHMTENEKALVLLKSKLDIFKDTDQNSKKLIDLKPETPLGSAYAAANRLISDQTGSHISDKDMLTAVNVSTRNNYTTFDSLPKYVPAEKQFHMNTFNKEQLGYIMTNIGSTYLNTLDEIITDTNPIPRP